VNTHSILFQAGPDGVPRSVKPTYVAVTEAADVCERVTAGACAGKPLPRYLQDSQVTVGWLVKRTLSKDRVLRFVTRTTVY
jgi:hypothetical protein